MTPFGANLESRSDIAHSCMTYFVCVREQVDPTGHKYNITSCNRTPEGWCNQTGNAHGGGIYTDNGSGGWNVSENVLADVYHWMFTWQPDKMVDMQFEHNWVDSPLFTNNAEHSTPPVRVVSNTLVARGGVWPAAAHEVMADAGARPAPALMRTK